MKRYFQVVVEGVNYDVYAVIAAHEGRAVLISVVLNGFEVGLVKLVSSILTAMLKWRNYDEEQFLDVACSHFLERQLVVQALASPERPLVIGFE